MWKSTKSNVVDLSIPKCRNLQLWVHNCLKKTSNLPLIIMLFQNLNGIVFQIVLPLHVVGHDIAIANWFTKTKSPPPPPLNRLKGWIGHHSSRTKLISSKYLTSSCVKLALSCTCQFFGTNQRIFMFSTYPPHNYSCCQYKTKIYEAWKVHLGIENHKLE